ncbi:hypothetical protein F4560_006663 [Saccharothrix ecbatanensis]|uniref:Uncharacterized protein n=1 Tax=Saccharothrix ecbatanensis TaxID=1105145 RepID=A0A7W9HR37_9PSEU|nr:hypothetical protein [Saccharothrix ecbatanensis]
MLVESSSTISMPQAKIRVESVGSTRLNRFASMGRMSRREIHRMW